MIGICPRCGTPRQGDLPICANCGLDFRTVPAPASCPRCGAPLYPGYTRCGNCGFDSGFAASSAGPGQIPPPWPGQMPGQMAPPAYGQMPGQTPPPWPGQIPAYTPMPAPQPPRNNFGGALILLGIALLVVAGGIIFVTLPKSSSASHAPGASTAALASPTESPTPEKTASPTESPTPEKTASPTVTDVPTPAPRTPEPSPDATWTRYTSPDGKWSVLYPGASPKPLKATQEVGTGIYKGDATVYAVMGPGAANGYMVMFVDFDASLFKGIDPSTLLPLMAASMAQGVGGTEVSTADSKIGAYPAQDETIQTKTQVVDLRMSFVGSRFYVLMTMSSPGDAIYPQHFMDSFKLK